MESGILERMWSLWCVVRVARLRERACVVVVWSVCGGWCLCPLLFREFANLSYT